MEKYSSGRRGVPAKDVGRAFPARGFKSLLLRQNKKHPVWVLLFCGRVLNPLSRRNASGGGCEKKRSMTVFSEAKARSKEPRKRGCAERPRRLCACRGKSLLLRQKRSNFFLPKVTSFFIQAAGLAYHHDAVVDIIKGGTPPLYLITL